MSIVLNPLALAATVTANTTAAAGKVNPVDATAGALTITLPTPANGTLLAVEKVDASANTVTVSGSIRGAAGTVVLFGQFEARLFAWTGATWRVIADHRTKAQLDATYAAFGSGGGTGTTADATTTTKGVVQLAGDLAGTAASPQLATLAGLTPGSYGDATHSARVTVDAKGRITAVTAPTITATGGLPFGSLVAGNYYYTAGQSSTSTATMSNGTVRAYPWILPVARTITRIGVEVTGAGDTGSTMRLGLYASDANGLPSTLAVDGGTVATDTVGVKEVTVSVALQPGIYWVTSLVQGAVTVLPTMRTVASTQFLPTVFLPIGSTGTPSVGDTRSGYNQTTAVPSGALPASWVGSSSSLGHPRVFVKVA